MQILFLARFNLETNHLFRLIFRLVNGSLIMSIRDTAKLDSEIENKCLEQCLNCDLGFRECGYDATLLIHVPVLDNNLHSTQ